MIRSAHITDIGSAVELVSEFITEYIETSPVYDSHDGVLNSRENKLRLQAMVMDWIKNHYVILAYNETVPVGIIAAVKENNYWDRDMKILREIAWYVRPQFRRTRISAELFLRWQEDIDQLITRKVIHKASISMPQGHETVDLNKRGWQPLEQHWIKG